MPCSQYIALPTNHVVYCDTAQQKKQPRADSTVTLHPWTMVRLNMWLAHRAKRHFFQRVPKYPTIDSVSCPLITRGPLTTMDGVSSQYVLCPTITATTTLDRQLSDSPQPSQSGRPFCQVWRFGGRSDFTRTDSALVLPRLRQASSGDQSCDM